MDVDCTLNKVFCSNFTLGGFPSVILYAAGVKHHFKESSRSIISFENFFNRYLTTELLNIPPILSTAPIVEVTESISSSETVSKKPSIYSDINISNRKFVEEISHDALKNNIDDKLVIFYPSSSDVNYLKVLRIVDQVSRIIRSEKPEFRFFKCGADVEDNKPFFDKARFNKDETYIFLNLQKGGICIILFFYIFFI